MRDKEPTRAGFGVRAAAYLIDRLLLLIALGILRLPLLAASFFGTTGLTRDILFHHSPLDLLSWALAAAYFVLLTYFGGGTLGKKLMRLRVQYPDGGSLRFIDVLYRETVGRYLSGILCLGYLMVLADKQDRAFHDWLCGSCVVYDEVTFRPREDGDPQSAAVQAPAYTLPGETVAAAEPAAYGEEEV